MSENQGDHSSNAALQESFNKCKTYLAMVAFVLQDSPGKMLTFSQLMDRLEAFGSMRTRSFENNIRVCLSTNPCFVKIAMNPSDPWNNWRLDHSKITEKMARRHLKGLICFFPEFTSMERKDMSAPPPDHYTTLYSPEAASCKAVNSRHEVKFSSSFSIESILKKDSPSDLVKVERKRSLSTETVDSYSSYADHGLTDDDDAARPTKRMCMSPSNATRQEGFKECKTYLAMIAFVLQDSPEKMLTFSQLMNRLDSLGSLRTKAFENTIRVRLSTDTCFVKISFSPESPCNYWKLDHSKITEKMVQRHFHGLLEWFPEFTSIERKGMLTPPAAPCKAVNSGCEVKFCSSFSIDSILKKDSPSGLCYKTSPWSEESSGSVKVERQLSWSTERTVGLEMKFTWDSSPVDIMPCLMYR